MHSNSGDQEQRPDCIVFSNASVKRGERLIWQHGDFSIPAGSVTAIVGTNGTGKTTMMKTELGLLPLAGGTVHVLGRPAGEMNRQIGYVPQSYTSDIDSNLTAEQSVLLGLTGTRFGVHFVTKAQRAKVKEAMTFTGIADKAHYRLSELSGGLRQRVAIARALVSRPRVLLLDEPLAALDLKLRKDMQQELKNIQKATGITFVFVTHDQEEALSMSDTIVVMSEGRIQQIGTPIDIYNEPENAFVADFIGESNIVDGIMRQDFSVTFSGHTFTCVDKGFAKNENVDVVVRPEDVDIVPIEKGMLRGTVTSITFMGVHYEIIIDINGFKWMIQTTDYVDEGAEVGLYIEPDAIHIMKKSEYSGMYGDYSSFSNELDELSDAESEPDE